MNYILFDGATRTALLPLTYTRPVAELRIGILTIREKWELYLGFATTTLTEEYLDAKFPMVEMEKNIMINASFLPTTNLVTLIQDLKENQAIFYGEDVLAFFTTEDQDEVNFDLYEHIDFDEEIIQIKNTWDLFALNNKAINDDFELLTDGRVSQPIPEGVQYINKDQIFIEEGATILFSSLNATNGPIFIGRNSIIMEGCTVRGPFALCENSILKMGTKVYGGTTIGPHSKIGGEVTNSVIFGNTNKGHDGFLGNSVLGEWCNLGADTNNSNLKNNYAEVRIWNYESENFAKTGLQFCGLIMGDHSKCAINTMFNTGTVVGVSCNIYGSNFPRNFIPSFSWGGAAGFSTYQIDKATETAKLVLQRRNLSFEEEDENILSHIFELSKKHRNY
ncbi:GlmU family protein [Lutibacter sp.]|uniref:GlmU family protein n=1 Tax=Lutibacter sp. TaxID=1925666 RepID=UPI0027347165|nr:GlmU family protein [Lutibacter sp.]MDP3311797.1 GlmU family protein [Lutibacter sp.]